MTAITFPASQNINLQCASCGKTENKTLKKCSRCSEVFYCSKECQTKEWPMHKKICHQAKSTISLEKIWEKIQRTFWQDKLPAACPISRDDLWLNLAKMDSEDTPFVKNFLQSFKPDKGAIALDLGIGNGQNTIKLLKQGWEVVAIDSNEKVIKQTKTKIDELPKELLEKLTIIQNNIEDCKLPTVDLIVASDILPYINPSKVKSVWENIFSALKPGGHLISNFFTTTDPKNLSSQRIMGAWIAMNEDEIKALVKSSYQMVDSCYRNSSKESFHFIAKKL